MKIPYIAWLWMFVPLTTTKADNDTYTQSSEIKDKSCGPQDEIITECVPFIKEDCPFINTFAPSAEDLNVEVVYLNVNQTIYITLHIRWKVPEQGVSKETLWGWQLRVLGKSGMVQNSQKCIQINRKDIVKTNVKFEDQTILLPSLPAIYLIEVQGLPSWDGPHLETVVRKEVKVQPDWCILHGSRYPCCDYHTDKSYKYINASLMVEAKNNSATMSWSTNFPRNLNISIEGYILKWVSHPNNTCHANYDTIMVLHRSSYKFSKLRRDCGNYLLTVEVIFKYREQTGCKYSPGVTFLYNPNPSPEADPVTRNVEKKNIVMTVGFTVAACVIAILIVLFILISKKRKGRGAKQLLEPLVTDIDDKDLVKTFILTPNHCNMCKDVVHKLATLLMRTGRITCAVDMFVPNNEKVDGPVGWGEKMIQENDYVLIPWLTARSQVGISQTDMNANTFELLLDSILGQLLADPNSKRKLVPVYLDHCSIDVVPSNQRILNPCRIPSNVDDLILDLIGKTARQPDGSQLQFSDKEYYSAKEALRTVVDRMRGHQCNKNAF